MTRDEFEKTVKKVGVSSYAEIYFSNKEALLAHDAEQRRVIEGLSAKVKNLTAWSDRMFGTPCAEIRHQQQVEMLEEKIKQQAQEIATLREALQGILEIGKRDMTNPKYDGYFEYAQQALKVSYSERKKNG